MTPSRRGGTQAGTFWCRPFLSGSSKDDDVEVPAQDRRVLRERAAMPRGQKQRVAETSASNARISQGEIWWSWLLWVNAILEEAYPSADLETGC